MPGGSTETCRTCINVTTTWTHINCSPNIVITGSLVNTMWQRIMWPCTLPTTRDTHWPVVTPGGFRRTLPRLPDLKLIRSNLFGVIRHKSVWTQLLTYCLPLKGCMCGSSANYECLYSRFFLSIQMLIIYISQLTTIFDWILSWPNFR